MAKLSNFWKGILWIKGSLIIGAAGALIAYENNDEIKQVEYNLFDKKQTVENNFFQDPPGLNVAWKSNESGKVETYLQYISNNQIVKEVEIMQDMLPNNKSIVKGLESRVSMNGVFLEIKNNELYAVDSSKKYRVAINKNMFSNQQANTAPSVDSIFNKLKQLYGGI